MLFWIPLFFLFSDVIFAATPENLKAPFTLESIQAEWGYKNSADFSCNYPSYGHIPAPIKAVELEDYYIDEYGSKIDPQKYKTYQESTKILEDFRRYLFRNTNALIRQKIITEAPVECVLNYLNTWAKADALTQETETNSWGMERNWTLAQLATTYALLKQTRLVSPSGIQLIDPWLRRLANRVSHDHSPHGLIAYQNNHQYWAGYSLAMTGIALNDSSFFAWGKEKFLKALQDIQSDGTLPAELARQSKALHYHNFSLQALVGLAELLEVNGIDAYALRDNRLQLLIDRVLDGLNSPDFFAEKTGEAQNNKEFSGCHLYCWMEPYYKRFQDVRVLPFLKKCRGEIGAFEFGADSTLLFGEKWH